MSPVLIFYPCRPVVELTNTIDLLREISNKWEHCAAQNQRSINTTRTKEVSHVEE